MRSPWQQECRPLVVVAQLGRRISHRSCAGIGRILFVPTRSRSHNFRFILVPFFVHFVLRDIQTRIFLRSRMRILRWFRFDFASSSTRSARSKVRDEPSKAATRQQHAAYQSVRVPRRRAALEVSRLAAGPLARLRHQQHCLGHRASRRSSSGCMGVRDRPGGRMLARRAARLGRNSDGTESLEGQRPPRGRGLCYHRAADTRYEGLGCICIGPANLLTNRFPLGRLRLFPSDPPRVAAASSRNRDAVARRSAESHITRQPLRAPAGRVMVGLAQRARRGRRFAETCRSSCGSLNVRLRPIDRRNDSRGVGKIDLGVVGCWGDC